MGTMRFTLALLVLLSHGGLYIQGRNPGVAAVVVFYLISGYVMAALVDRYYLRVASTWRFYADRLMRIYPQYGVYAILTFIWFATVGHTTLFLQHSPSLIDVINNVLVVPLNFFMYNHSDRFTLIPPAWSLGAELLFYLLVPWLWRRLQWAIWLGATSFGVQVLSWFGVLHTDTWGYRLLPGVLWVFVLGMLLFKLHAKKRQSAAWVLSLAGALVLLLTLTTLQHFQQLSRPYSFEVLLGVAVGLPFLNWLAGAWTSSAKLMKADDWLGNLSYGVFLNHFLVMWVMGWNPGLTSGQLALLAVFSTLLSGITWWLVERPVLRWRRQYRQQLNH